MASIWNPAVVLDINQGHRKNLCVAMGAEGPCNNPIGSVRRESDEILRRMSQMSPSSTDIPRMLALLAPVTLCTRWHRDKPRNRQDERMQHIWTKNIREYVLKTQRIEAARQLIESTPAPNIIPQPRTRSPVVSPVALAHSANVSVTQYEPFENFDFDDPASAQPEFPDFDDSAIDLSADIRDDVSNDDEIQYDEAHDDEIQYDETHDDEIHDDGIHDDEIHDDESEDSREQVEQTSLQRNVPCQCQSIRQPESLAQNQAQVTQNQPSPPAPLKFELSLQLTLHIPHLFSYPASSIPSSTPLSNPSLSYYLFAFIHACFDILLQGLSSFRKSIINSKLFLAAKLLVLWAWREISEYWGLFEEFGMVGFAILSWVFGGLGLGMR